MPFKLTIPARINILGNPSDANEGDFATISSAVDIYAYANIEEADEISIAQREKSEHGLEIALQEQYKTTEIPLPYTGTVDLAKAGVNRLWDFSQEFRTKLSIRGFRLSLWTDVPRQSGLGGSSLFVLLTLGGLRALYGLDPILHNDYALAEIAQRAEAKELDIYCGFADRYVPLFGGIGYLDYHGKLHQKSLHEEPYVTYERLDHWINDDLPLVAVCSGLEHDSGDVHGRMRPRYIKEYDAWISQGGRTPPMVEFMSRAYETAWRGKIALLQRDWDTFGRLMNLNHQAVDEMMTFCGFEDGAGWANNLLIEAALANGALGAKLTGAGGGGSVFAITEPGAESSLIQAWGTTIARAGLEKACIYQPRIARQGLMIEPMDQGG